MVLGQDVDKNCGNTFCPYMGLLQFVAYCACSVNYSITILVYSGGFLVLGQDVDKNCGNASMSVWDCYGFEKLQGFSGKIRETCQLNS